MHTSLTKNVSSCYKFFLIFIWRLFQQKIFQIGNYLVIQMYRTNRWCEYQVKYLWWIVHLYTLFKANYYIIFIWSSRLEPIIGSWCSYRFEEFQRMEPFLKLVLMKNERVTYKMKTMMFIMFEMRDWREMLFAYVPFLLDCFNLEFWSIVWFFLETRSLVFMHKLIGHGSADQNTLRHGELPPINSYINHVSLNIRIIQQTN